MEQSTKPKSLLQCCGYCSNNPPCDAIRFENGVCKLFKDLECCQPTEERTELFVNDEIIKELQRDNENRTTSN